MHEGTKRKMKVYAADVALVFLAFQAIAVCNYDNCAQASQNTVAVCECEGTGISLIAEPLGAEAQESERSVPIGDADSEILLKIAMAEAEGEGVKGKALVMRVVLNRTDDGRFPDSVKGVVFQKGQFTPTEDGGRYWDVEPDRECSEALLMVREGWDESQGALYFSRTGSSPWMEKNTEYLFTAGNHSFYR